MQVSAAQPGLAATFGLNLPMVPLLESFMGHEKAHVLAALLATPVCVGMALGGNHAASRVIFALSRAGKLKSNPAGRFAESACAD